MNHELARLLITVVEQSLQADRMIILLNFGMSKNKQKLLLFQVI